MNVDFKSSVHEVIGKHFNVGQEEKKNQWSRVDNNWTQCPYNMGENICEVLMEMFDWIDVFISNCTGMV